MIHAIYIYLICNTFLTGALYKTTHWFSWEGDDVKENIANIFWLLVMFVCGVLLVLLVFVWYNILYPVLDLIQIPFYFRYFTGIGLAKLTTAEHLAHLNKKRDYFLEQPDRSLAERHFIFIVNLLNKRYYAENYGSEKQAEK